MMKIFKKLKNCKIATKFPLALKICKSAVNAIFFCSKTLNCAYMLLRLFVEGKGTKNGKCLVLLFFLGTKNPRDVCVIVAAFWRKIRAMPLRYFLQIALHYCKIKVCHTLANVFWMFFSGKQYYRLKHSSRRWKSAPDESRHVQVHNTI